MILLPGYVVKGRTYSLDTARDGFLEAADSTINDGNDAPG